MGRPAVERETDRFKFAVVDFGPNADILEITTKAGVGMGARVLLTPEDLFALKEAIDVALSTPRSPRVFPEGL